MGKKDKKTSEATVARDSGYFFAMRDAPRIDKDYHMGYMVPVVIFAALSILMVHMISYTRPMADFYWTNSADDLSDFFSYGKMVIVLAVAGLALICLMGRWFSGNLAVKKTWVYIPMAVYSLFVLISYAFSDYKKFSLLGYNDRFEGTLVLLAYMVMLFFIINTVNTERSAKVVIFAILASCTLLGLLGLSQGTGHDFFQTNLGKKLITPTSMWDNLDSLNFTFQHNEIYQTVYNINYVSFYLAMIIPIAGLLLVHAFNGGKEVKIWKKILIVAVFALLIYNIIGAASAGGFAGLAVAFVAAIILFNKRLIKWWKSVLAMFLVVVVIGACTTSIWAPQIFGVFASTDTSATASADTGAGSATANADNSANPTTANADTANAAAASATQSADPAAAADGTTPASADSTAATDQSTTSAPATDTSADPTAGETKPYIDYISTESDEGLAISLNGNMLIFAPKVSNGSLTSLYLIDEDGNDVATSEIGGTSEYAVNDDRFHDYIKFWLTADDQNNLYLVTYTAGQEWYFLLQEDGVIYRNGFGKTVELDKVDAVGFKNNPNFGSGRGYIWSRTFPMMPSTALIGNGADTYCLTFPHNDYAGKYDDFLPDNIDIIVDKAHDMYMGMWLGTSGISVFAFFAMLVIYILQSINVLRGRKYKTWNDYTAAGLFLGVIGFAIAGLFNDSSVSVMPMFYSVLGTGIAVNTIIKRNENNSHINNNK